MRKKDNTSRMNIKQGEMDRKEKRRREEVVDDLKAALETDIPG